MLKAWSVVIRAILFCNDRQLQTAQRIIWRRSAAASDRLRQEYVKLTSSMVSCNDVVEVFFLSRRWLSSIVGDLFIIMHKSSGVALRSSVFYWNTADVMLSVTVDCRQLIPIANFAIAHSGPELKLKKSPV